MPDPTKEVKVPANVPQRVTPKNVTSTNGPGFYSFYCNNVAFAVNQLDIAVILGEIVDISNDLEAMVERRARVTFVPAQAKALGKILDYAVRVWEFQNHKKVEDLDMNLPEIPENEG